MTNLTDVGVIKPQSNIFLGSVYICLSATMFALAGAAVKLALADIQPLQLVFWRNLLSLVIFMSWIALAKPQTFREMKTSKLKLHFIRSILSLLVLYSYFYAVANTELATAVLLLSTSPVFVPIIAFIWLKHRSAATVWAGTLVAFIGVSLIINPSFGFNFDWANISGVAFGLAAGCLGGAATVSIWKMSDTESPDRQIFYFTIISFLFSIPFAIYSWKWPQLETFLPIIALGIATTLAQFYLSKGCSVAPADKINTWNYISVIIAAIAAYIGWNESLSLLTISGMILVVGGAHIASIVSSKR
ncbi:MAG: DMT family transporter [Sneathiella sp.]